MVRVGERRFCHVVASARVSSALQLKLSGGRRSRLDARAHKLTATVCVCVCVCTLFHMQIVHKVGNSNGT